MRRTLFLLPSLFLLLVPRPAVAQGTAGGPLLTEDLCGCMTDIDLQSDDRTVTFGVRHCLEEAVMAHPGEILSLLQRDPEQNNKAYLLGLILGGALEGSCDRFRAVKARLQQMPGQGSLKKPGT